MSAFVTQAAKKYVMWQVSFEWVPCAAIRCHLMPDTCWALLWSNTALMGDIVPGIAV